MDSSETGSILTEEDFRDADFQWSAFEAAYSPKTWGMKRPQGPLEEARRRSGRHQARHVIAQIPSNTTVIGMTQEAGITGGGLSIDGGENIVVRGLRFRQARDYFPQWDPSDGRAGDWNAQYDSLALRRATRVWVDGNHFSSHISEETPRTLFDRPIEHFDALLDITHRSDLITVSWNRFEEHRKVTLVGGSDRADDADALRVTFHHNHYRDVGSRAPRVRFGKVHLYNNLYTMSAGAERWFDYSIGLGKESQVLMQSNAWEIPKDIPLNRLLKNWGGRVLKEVDSSVNGRSVQLKAAIELDQQVSFDSEATFFPPYRFRLEPSASLRDVITRGAGSTLN
jgi:pectate lyase